MKLRALNTIQDGKETYIPGQNEIFDCESEEEARRLVDAGAAALVVEEEPKKAAPAPVVMNTKDKLKLVGECKTAEDLDKLLEGEIRQTVLEAIAKKRERLQRPQP